MAAAFARIYSPTVELVISFPQQVMLSQKRPPQEIRIDQAELKESRMLFLPTDTFAYTT